MPRARARLAVTKVILFDHSDSLVTGVTMAKRLRLGVVPSDD